MSALFCGVILENFGAPQKLWKILARPTVLGYRDVAVGKCLLGGGVGYAYFYKNMFEIYLSATETICHKKSHTDRHKNNIRIYHTEKSNYTI